MIMIHLLIKLVFATWFAQTGDAPSRAVVQADPALDAKLHRIETKMAEIRSLHCHFVQTKNLALFDQTLVIRGEIFMRQPGLFAWHVHDPMRVRMVIRDEKLQQWDQDTGRVQTISLRRNPAIQTAMTQMQAWFSGRYTALKDEYSVTLVNDHTLRFVPLESTLVAELITRVDVSFLQDESYIRSIEIVESSGDQTDLRFEEIQLNIDVPDQVFQAEPGD